MPDIATLEKAVYQRRPDVVAQLLDVLYALVTGKMRLEGTAPDEPDAGIGLAATRLAAAIGALFIDRNVTLTDSDIRRLAVLKWTIENTFRASGFASSDYVLQALGAGDTASFARLWQTDRRSFVKASLLLSIDSKLPIDVEALLVAHPQLTLLCFLGLLSVKPITSAEGHARRKRLLELAPRLQQADLPSTADHLVLLSSAWMLCSYAEGRDKHQIKSKLNPIVRAWLRKEGMSDTELPAERRLVDRPTLIVAAEIMHSNHVQYRYFGQYLRQLRTRFRLVLLTEEKEVDDHVRALYDDVFAFKRRSGIQHLEEAVAFIKRTRPDLIFWLSVGMRHWGPVIANLRLAPIQFTALGHSASTFCQTVDYYLTEEGYIGDAALFSEQLVLLPDRSLVFERSPHYRPIAPHIRERAYPLRVALPSNLLKLNPAFIEVLEKIRGAADRPLEFHLFPAVSGMEFNVTRRLIDRKLPGSTVHPAIAYNNYLERLSACDLNLSPFPFGGLHSVVDSLRQGLPVVAMEGLEPHSRTDSMLLRRLGMPAWLVCHSVDEYVGAALRIIGNDDLRVEVSRQAAALDIDAVLFGDATTPLRTEVVDAVWWLYRHHEAVKASGRNAFTAADRAAFPAA